MAPTYYTQIKFLFTGSKEQSDTLPSSVENNPGDISDLLAFVESKEAVPKEDRIIIPKINVDAPIVDIPEDSNKAVLDAIQHGVGHYPGSADPGRIGNSFFTGHSSYYWWSGGEYNQIFSLLHKLGPGDLVYIYFKGEKFVYRMRDAVVVRPTDVHVLDASDKPTISLMTCTPIGTNLKRLVVRGDLISRPPVDGTDFGSVQEIPKIPTILPLY